MWEPRRLTTLWAFMACYRDSFAFFYLLRCAAIYSRWSLPTFRRNLILPLEWSQQISLKRINIYQTTRSHISEHTYFLIFLCVPLLLLFHPTTAESGFGFLQSGRYSFPHSVQTGSGATSSMGNRVPFPAIKRPRREADQSPPSGAEVTNVTAVSPLPPYVFMAWCVIKHRDRLIVFTSLFFHTYFLSLFPLSTLVSLVLYPSLFLFLPLSRFFSFFFSSFSYIFFLLSFLPFTFHICSLSFLLYFSSLSVFLYCFNSYSLSFLIYLFILSLLRTDPF
jgi:hypothetical protein